MAQFDCIENGYNLKAVDGYTDTSDETRKSMSDAAVERLSDPEFRKKHQKMTKEVQNRPKQRELLRQQKLQQRNPKLAACATPEERSALLLHFEQLDAFNARVTARKDSGAVRVKRYSPEWYEKQKNNSAASWRR